MQEGIWLMTNSVETKNKIFVTQPMLPELSDVYSQIEEIWESKWLTNMGKKHNELESRLTNVLKVPYVSLFNNGTIALMVAIKALDLPYGSGSYNDSIYICSNSTLYSMERIKTSILRY